jgi:hypothetical protein
MATQTRSQRQTAAQKAAATRKRNATKRSAAATKTSARRTRASASAGTKQTTRSAGRTSRQATRTAGRGLDFATTRVQVLGRRAQRALLIPVGAAASVGDKVRQTARTYTSVDSVVRELDKFERRGARVLGRRQRELSRHRREFRHEVRATQRELGSRVNGLRTDAKEAADQVMHLI